MDYLDNWLNTRTHWNRIVLQAWQQILTGLTNTQKTTEQKALKVVNQQIKYTCKLNIPI